MNIKINQKISQLLDEDLSPLEEEILLQKISQQVELQNKLNRYQAISEALKTNQFTGTKTSFLDKINQQIKQEPSHFLAESAVDSQVMGFWKNGRIAIAASAIVVVMLLLQLTDW